MLVGDPTPYEHGEKWHLHRCLRIEPRVPVSSGKLSFRPRQSATVHVRVRHAVLTRIYKVVISQAQGRETAGAASGAGGCEPRVAGTVEHAGTGAREEGGAEACRMRV